MEAEKMANPNIEQVSGQPDVSPDVSPIVSPIGAVMVVGGGIAGIQASLDLANSGYLVHLVE